jgi:hypothetical protein
VRPGQDLTCGLGGPCRSGQPQEDLWHLNSQKVVEVRETARVADDGTVRGGEWLGSLDRTVYNDSLGADSDRLADAARAGDWPAVFRVLDDSTWIGVNQWRVGGKSWFAPLHQAAWHGADLEVVDSLLARGAWRSLREASGKLPVDIARERGHAHLLDRLGLPETSPLEAERYTAWDEHLKRLVESRIARIEPVPLRYVSTEVVAREGLRPLWFAVPGMYGGFSIEVFKGRLFVESWSRVAEGSGQAHVITTAGAVLVDEGFV